MRHHLLSWIVSIMLSAVTMSSYAQSSGFEKLDEWTKIWKEGQRTYFGYPCNQQSPLHEFYRWYVGTGMDQVNLNNAGDPMTDHPWNMSSQAFEREVIEFFAPLYGYDKKDVWGIVTHSGTDGNNHGIYFGANVLFNTTGKKPVVYVSDEAHYSNMRLCDLQNLDLKLIKSDPMGRMIPEELEAALDTTRPALVVYAMGSTFKGAIDDMQALNAVLAKHPGMPVYRHVDAALFGGYLPFTKHQKMVSCKDQHFESIAISGHKFFGIDSPSGLFLCTREVYDNQNNFNVTYLNSNMKMINCSRDAVQPLKFWWLIQRVGYDQWCQQAEQMMECTAYLQSELQKIGWPCWRNEYSNTVFFLRPSPEICNKYTLALGFDRGFGGELAHVVVMQHVTKEKIDPFIEALKQETEAAIRAMCQTMVERYPAATLQDVYKTCYQDFFGAEHMITDTTAVRQYLHSELAELPKEDVLPISELTGYRHRFQRMNLRAVQEGTMTEEDLLRAFLEAGHTEPVGISWQDEWSRIERIALDVHPAWKNKSLQRDLNKAAQQKAAVRHSESFRKTYKPHYRIIRK